MEWIIGLWILMGIILTWWCYWFLCVKKENADRVKHKKKKKKGKVPRGNRGWPLLGETLEFIASAYTSNPVSFMEKRKSLLAASIERIAYPKKEEQKSLLLP